MTTEDDFQATLDADPTDYATRLVFADWLEERGDQRAEGMRILGEWKKWPLQNELMNRKWMWYWHNKGFDVGEHAVLGLLVDFCHAKYTTRREAEDAACLAWLRLTDEQRAEIRGRAYKREENHVTL